MSLVGLLIVILLALLICWLITLFPVDGRIQRILQIVVVVFVLLYVLGSIAGWGPVIRVG